MPTYHIAAPARLILANALRHQPLDAAPGERAARAVSRKCLTADGDFTVALAAGASTPDSVVGEVIEKLTLLAGPE